MPIKTSPIRFDAKTTTYLLSDEAAKKVTQKIAGLNPEQHAAVMAIDGPVIVEAGAGTGKTSVLITRIAELISLGHAVPERILAVTFTNKAAAEMRERLADLIGEDAAGEVCIGSFHAVCLSMLRRHAIEAGLRDDDFRIYDDGDQMLVMHAAMEKVGIIDSWRRAGATQRDHSQQWNERAKLLLDQVQEWKDEGRTIEDIEEAIQAPELKVMPGVAEAARIYRAYQAELDRRNAVDFADIILRMVTLFRKSPKVKEHWANRFSFILVDEFQDTDSVQYEWLTTIAEKTRNLFAVGDLDQCIYEWRNARPEIFAGFAEDWTGAKKIRLHRNYRSTQEILDVASNVVEKGEGRGTKARLSSGRSGDEVKLQGFDTDIEEATWIAEQVGLRIACGTAPGEIAILFRQSKNMPHIEQALAKQGVAYAVVSGIRFHKREEIKDILSWVALAIDTSDEIALLRCAQRPGRAIDDGSLGRAIVQIRNGEDTAKALASVAAHDQWATSDAKSGLAALASSIATISALATTAGVAQLIERILEETGYIAWRQRSGIAADDLDDIIEALLEQARNFAGTAGEFLQEFALIAEADAPDPDAAVRLSTIHAAKGLEWDVVFTPCLEEGVLPNDRSLKHEKFIKEERNILHVAWTRARLELVPSFARSRQLKPALHSRFLKDGGLLRDHHVVDGRTVVRSTTRYATTTMIKPIKLVAAKKN